MSDSARKRILYGTGSPNVRKVGLMLEELGLDYALDHVSVYAGAQFAPEFLALNPLGKVPVLIDPRAGGPLFESCAILIFLAENYGGGFLPESGHARDEVLRWLMVQTALVGPMLGQYNHFHLVVARGTEPYAAGRYRNQSETVYRQLDRRLADNAWLAGGAYSIADIATWPWAFYVERHGFDPADYPHLIRWRDAIAARPAAAVALEKMAQAFDASMFAARRAATPEHLDAFFNRRPGSPLADFSPIVRA